MKRRRRCFYHWNQAASLLSLHRNIKFRVLMIFWTKFSIGQTPKLIDKSSFTINSLLMFRILLMIVNLLLIYICDFLGLLICAIFLKSRICCPSACTTWAEYLFESKIISFDIFADIAYFLKILKELMVILWRLSKSLLFLFENINALLDRLMFLDRLG